ncbi:iron-containing alcohol dehydrogenase [Rhodoferax sp. U2-2l]|uniref:iron-containing alcohol dehydrogenase n=1 Tax=Rhodoferax sp. U2-2l TaxID=2884000 RepID=UPI001D09CB47|nr:iron-containing alcohol dehydrogenase [Rhodoferax sp. U2-2l]MCB8746226.1 iron-containing alcohol dehydrogenase [Rhodoferax sp. U2-2l]
MMLTNLLSGTVRSVGLTAVMRAVGVATRLLPIPQPTMLVGPGASARLGQAICDFDHTRVLVVTDPVVAKLGLMAPLLAALKAGGTAYVVFDKMLPDAPVALIEQGVALFKRKGCDAVIAFGGGSAMDAAKAIALAAANNKHPAQLAGYFKGLRTPAPIYAVPTTAGTGSEVTVAAVISDPDTQRKLVIADTRIVPRMAALDPNLMLGLPPDITAATGMDALTHAIEAYIGHWRTAFTDRMALSAVGMIFEALPVAYANGQDLAAREKMALAANYAGQAFTRANVGYVHAIAHQLGGRYHTPHGLANAILLPHVLRFMRPAIEPQLAQLALRSKVGKKTESDAVLASKFLDAIDAMNTRLGIPTTLAALREEDIPALARAACHEAMTNYPVPVYLSQAECEGVIRLVLPHEPLGGVDADSPVTTEKAARRRVVAKKAQRGRVAAREKKGT